MKISVIIPSIDGRRPEGIPEDPRLEVVVVEGVSPVGEARNEGLRRATGEWIAWVDADDAVAPGWLDGICAAIDANPGCDVVSFDARVVWCDGSGRRSYRTGGKADAADVMAERAAGQLWNKVIRRELFAGLRFAGAAHEDYRLLCALLPRAGRVVHVAEELYVYRRRKDGLSQHPDREVGIEALRGLVGMCAGAEERWRGEIAKGVVQRIADFERRAGKVDEFRGFVRKWAAAVVRDSGIGWRVKVKVVMAAAGIAGIGLRR